ncbi:MAG: hypothetical protein JO108_00115 [Acidobacteriaceae bacterium]|nr:hypothetical protein [Acidobacteriaceae bacterium]
MNKPTRGCTHFDRERLAAPRQAARWRRKQLKTLKRTSYSLQKKERLADLRKNAGSDVLIAINEISERLDRHFAGDRALFLLDTAVRIGEALGVQWSTLNLEHAETAKSATVKVLPEKAKNIRSEVCR